jgi:hypothetical protein
VRSARHPDHEVGVEGAREPVEDGQSRHRAAGLEVAREASVMNSWAAVAGSLRAASRRVLRKEYQR